MSTTRIAVLAVLALVVAAAVWTQLPMNPAPTPPAPTPTAAPKANPPAPAAVVTAEPAKPAQPAAPTAETAPPPVSPAQAPVAPAAPPAPPAAEVQPPAPAAPGVQTADPFGEEQVLTARKVVTLSGSANWDSAFETLVGSLKTLSAFIEKQDIKRAGPVLIVYTATDDTGFTYLAEIPVDQEPKNLAKGMSIGTSPEGRTLKFVHRGSYDNMDNTYEAITNHLDERKLEAKDTFIEEYVTDPLTTAEDNLVINVFVPLK
jgi:effector-binding domain-containing protein